MKLLQSLIFFADKDCQDEFENYYPWRRAHQNGLYHLFQRHPKLNEIARNCVILEALTEVLRDNIILYENSLIYKAMGKSNDVPLYQNLVPRPRGTRKCIAWCAIDNVTRETGALKVVPGSHKLGFLPWYRVEDELIMIVST